MTNQPSLFTTKELEKLDRTHIPYHIAIIPDGNRRWAKSNVRKIQEGYKEGADALITTVKAAKELGVKVLTVFSFSTENWSRPQLEVEALLHLFRNYLKSCQTMMLDLGVRLRVIGDIAKMPPLLIDSIEETMKLTQDMQSLDLVLAMNYGSRDEIKRAVRKIAQDCIQGRINLDQLTEEKINDYLDTSIWPDPDLVIRTSGEKRVSNFLLWQSSYAEIYTEDVNWPSFTPQHLLKAILDFQLRERRRGGG